MQLSRRTLLAGAGGVTAAGLLGVGALASSHLGTKYVGGTAGLERAYFAGMPSLDEGVGATWGTVVTTREEMTDLATRDLTPGLRTIVEHDLDFSFMTVAVTAAVGTKNRQPAFGYDATDEGDLAVSAWYDEPVGGVPLADRRYYHYFVGVDCTRSYLCSEPDDVTVRWEN